MIIDGHVHVGKTEKCSRYVEPGSLHYADEYVIMPNVSSEKRPMQANDELMSCDFGGNKCHRLLLIDPWDNNCLGKSVYGCFATQDRIEKNSIAGFKYHPSVCQMPASHTMIEPYLELLDGKIFMVHCGRDRMSDYQYAHKVAIKHPKIKVIAAHLGGMIVDKVEATLRYITHNPLPPNMYFDTSAVYTTWLIEKFIAVVGIDRVIFGTDIPYNDYGISRFVIECLNIPEEDKERILGKNMKGLLDGEKV